MNILMGAFNNPNEVLLDYEMDPMIENTENRMREEDE